MVSVVVFDYLVDVSPCFKSLHHESDRLGDDSHAGIVTLATADTFQRLNGVVRFKSASEAIRSQTCYSVCYGATTSTGFTEANEHF